MEQQTLFPYFPNKKRKSNSFLVREIAPRYWSDFEVLTAVAGEEAAKLLLEAVGGNLSELLNFEAEQFQITGKISPVKARQLKAALELGKRVSTAKLPVKANLNSPGEVASFLMAEMLGLQKEYFNTILLNTKNQILAIEEISVGSLNSSIVHPREVFNPAIKKSAGSIILVHNHPSGDPTPSREDIDVTARLIEAGKILGIHVLDHIIIGNNNYVSFKERGLLS
jgi:DNA repair protein RadC